MGDFFFFVCCLALEVFEKASLFPLSSKREARGGGDGSNRGRRFLSTQLTKRRRKFRSKEEEPDAHERNAREVRECYESACARETRTVGRKGRPPVRVPNPGVCGRTRRGENRPSPHTHTHTRRNNRAGRSREAVWCHPTGKCVPPRLMAGWDGPSRPALGQSGNGVGLLFRFSLLVVVCFFAYFFFCNTFFAEER